MSKIAKYVLLTSREGRREDLIRLLDPVRVASQAEVGTEVWSLHMVTGSPDAVALYEVYVNEAAAEEHDRLPALAEALRQLGGVLAGEPSITVLEVHSTLHN